MIHRKENGQLKAKAGLDIIDNVLSTLSNNPISNRAVATEFAKINNDLSEKQNKTWTKVIDEGTIGQAENIGVANEIAIYIKTNTNVYLLPILIPSIGGLVHGNYTYSASNYVLFAVNWNTSNQSVTVVDEGSLATTMASFDVYAR